MGLRTAGARLNTFPQCGTVPQKAWPAFPDGVSGKAGHLIAARGGLPAYLTGGRPLRPCPPNKNAA